MLLRRKNSSWHTLRLPDAVPSPDGVRALAARGRHKVGVGNGTSTVLLLAGAPCACLVLSPPQVGCTPLHRAASAGKVEVCRWLLEQGAKVDAKDRQGQTPLMMAAICNHEEVREGATVFFDSTP